MSIAFGSMLLWAIPELIGSFSPEAEDTYSEWVWDLPFFWLMVIVGLQTIAGLLMIGSNWHFIEGYFRRRKIEKNRRK